jgi:ribonucleoside-diphosphate reductase alpha chain
MIIEHAWKTGEPGVVFIDRVNEKNPIKNVGLIEATNPCGEQPLHPYDSCNLGSVNLGGLVKGEGANARFDWDEYKSIIHTTTRFLDNVIEVNKYPLPQIDNMSKTTRRIGLGVMGFADALYKLNIPYNSEQGTAFGERIMQVLNDESHLASEILAEERGVFPAWEGSDWEKAGRRLRAEGELRRAPCGWSRSHRNSCGARSPSTCARLGRIPPDRGRAPPKRTSSRPPTWPPCWRASNGRARSSDRRWSATRCASATRAIPS